MVSITAITIIILIISVFIIVIYVDNPQTEMDEIYVRLYRDVADMYL